MPLDNDGAAEHISQRRGQAEQQTGCNRMHADSQDYQVGSEVSNSQNPWVVVPFRFQLR